MFLGDIWSSNEQLQGERKVPPCLEARQASTDTAAVTVSRVNGKRTPETIVPRVLPTSYFCHSHIFTLLLVLQHTIRLALLGPVTLKIRINAITNPATACVVRNDRLIHREKRVCQRTTRRKH